MTDTTRVDIPPPTAPNFSGAVREALQVMMGRRGNVLDQAVTFRHLQKLGLVTGSGGRGGAGWSPAPGGGPGGTPGKDYVPDLTPPPTPTGFEVSSGITNVFMDTDAPLFTMGRGYERTTVYGKVRVDGDPAPTFVDATRVTDFIGMIGTLPTNPATTWHLWIKWQTRDGVESVAPAGGTNGLAVRTGEDVAALLEILTGHITESQLYSTLGARIGLIDGGGPGSVNARIAPLQGSIDTINAQLAEATGAPDHDPELAYVADKVVKNGGKLYRAKVNVPAGTAITNTTYWELIGEYASLGEAVVAHAVQLSDHETRISATQGGLTAEAAARDTLATQMRGGYTGTDVNALTQGLVFNERQARSSAISAEAATRQTLIANVTSASSDNLVTNPTYDPAGYRDLVPTGNYIVGYQDRAADPNLAGAPAARLMVFAKNVSAAEYAGRSIHLSPASLVRVPANVGDTFDISYSALSGPAAAGTTYIWLYGADINGNPVGNNVVVAYNHAAPGTWQKLSGNVTLSGGAVFVGATLTFSPDAPLNHYVWICDVDIRKRSAGALTLAAAVQTEASVRASVDGYLGAQQNVRIDVAGHVSGYGIAGSSANGSGAGATSAFGVRANSFYVAPPSLAQNTAPTVGLYDGFVWLDTSVTPAVTRYRSGNLWTTASPSLPFIILTTPTTINGVAVPAGVYMKDAFILNGTITNAKMANLAVDDAKIANLSVSKILAGSMVVGQYISSANYVSGVQGWSINGAGGAEFSGVVVRGGVYASWGTVGGINIAGGALYSGNWVWDGVGFYLGADGNAYFNNLRARGSVMGGAYSAYSWPAAGQTGYYLGAEGLLVGNANNGRYFQLDSQGNVYAPNFSIINGNPHFSGSGSFSGNINATGVFAGHLEAATGTIRAKLTADNIDAVNTLNVAGGAITTTRHATWPAVYWWRMGAALASIGFNNIPAGSSGISLRGLATVRLVAGEFAGTLNIYIVRNNDTAVIGTGIAILDNMGGGNTSISLPVAVDAFDPNPIVGYSEYSIRVGRVTPASSDTGGQLYSASIIGTGGKR